MISQDKEELHYLLDELRRGGGVMANGTSEEDITSGPLLRYMCVNMHTIKVETLEATSTESL